jgi:hypothetical protein
MIDILKIILSGTHAPLVSELRTTHFIHTVQASKLTGPQLVKKFPAFSEIRKFIAVFRTVYHFSIYLAILIQSTPFHVTP